MGVGGVAPRHDGVQVWIPSMTQLSPFWIKVASEGFIGRQGINFTLSFLSYALVEADDFLRVRMKREILTVSALTGGSSGVK
jgi:hypothetical protein